MKRLLIIALALLCCASAFGTGMTYFSPEDTLGHFRTNYNSTVSNLYALIVAGDTNATGTLPMSGINLTVADTNNGIGPELITDGTFSASPLPWTLSACYTNNGQLVTDAGLYGTFAPSSAVAAVAGASYQVAFSNTTAGAGTITLVFGGVTNAITLPCEQKTVMVVARTVEPFSGSVNATALCAIDGVSIKRIGRGSGAVAGDLSVGSNLVAVSASFGTLAWGGGGANAGTNISLKNDVIVLLGAGASAPDTDSGVAVGYMANGGDYGTAFGYEAYGYSEGVGIGWRATGTLEAVAVGTISWALGEAVAVGYDANAYNKAVAIGREANASNGIAIGRYSMAGTNAIAIGEFVTNTTRGSTAVKGTLYLDGGTGVLYRATFGTGEWTALSGDGSGGNATNIGGYTVATLTGLTNDDRLAWRDGVWTNVAAGAMTEYDLIAGVGVTNNAASIVSVGAVASNAIPSPAGAVQGVTAWYNGTNWVVNTNALWLGTNWLFYWSSTNSPARFPCNGE